MAACTQCKLSTFHMATTLETQENLPDPCGHGWEVSDKEELKIYLDD